MKGGKKVYCRCIVGVVKDVIAVVVRFVPRGRGWKKKSFMAVVLTT